MDVYINSNLQQLQDNAKIVDALASLNINAQKGIAIAINNNVIPRQEWATHDLAPGDKITLIKATQGG
jgi:sulfur carrier protein